MSKIKRYFIVTMVSIGIGTSLSAVIYLLFGRGSFNLLHPFTMPLSDPIYNATLGILIYCAFGIAVFSASEIFRENNIHATSKTHYVIKHFSINVIIFSALAVLTSYPIGVPVPQVWTYYTTDIGTNGLIMNFLIGPIIEAFVIYLIVYISLWLAYRRQVRKLNKVLKNKKTVNQ
ncbi:DUF3021 family protein [Leuconostoc citreum]|uniref:DUF3021 family protein n=1 Tax=Leuconostoc citreum TaxID=33964 RepID=UPI003C584594